MQLQSVTETKGEIHPTFPAAKASARLLGWNRVALRKICRAVTTLTTLTGK